MNLTPEQEVDVAKAKALAALLPGWEATEGGYTCYGCTSTHALCVRHRPLPKVNGQPRGRAHFLCAACGWNWHKDVQGVLRETGK